MNDPNIIRHDEIKSIEIDEKTRQMVEERVERYEAAMKYIHNALGMTREQLGVPEPRK
jgi:hypothetical protein